MSQHRFLLSWSSSSQLISELVLVFPLFSALLSLQALFFSTRSSRCCLSISSLSIRSSCLLFLQNSLTSRKTKPLTGSAFSPVMLRTDIVNDPWFYLWQGPPNNPVLCCCLSSQLDWMKSLPPLILTTHEQRQHSPPSWTVEWRSMLDKTCYI